MENLPKYYHHDEICQLIADKLGIPKAKVRRVVELFFRGVRDEMKKGQIVSVRKLGVFKPSRKASLLNRRKRKTSSLISKKRFSNKIIRLKRKKYTKRL